MLISLSLLLRVSLPPEPPRPSPQSPRSAINPNPINNHKSPFITHQSLPPSSSAPLSATSASSAFRFIQNLRAIRNHSKSHQQSQITIHHSFQNSSSASSSALSEPSAFRFIQKPTGAKPAPQPTPPSSRLFKPWPLFFLGGEKNLSPSSSAPLLDLHASAINPNPINNHKSTFITHQSLPPSSSASLRDLCAFAVNPESPIPNPQSPISSPSTLAVKNSLLPEIQD
jgi:hypothetical protein